MQRAYERKIAELTIGGRYDLEIWDDKKSDIPRYRLWVLDSKTRKTIENVTFYL